MDALKPFNSKLVTLTRRGGFFTKITALAHGAAVANAIVLLVKKLEIKKNYVTFIISVLRVVY